MNWSDSGQTEETVVSLATVPNGLFKNAFRSGVPMAIHLVCTHVAHRVLCAARCIRAKPRGAFTHLRGV